jgi:hypothetical protein
VEILTHLQGFSAFKTLVTSASVASRGRGGPPSRPRFAELPRDSRFARDWSERWCGGPFIPPTVVRSPVLKPPRLGRDVSKVPLTLVVVAVEKRVLRRYLPRQGET